MAITVLINGVDTAVALGDATSFDITEPTPILADYMEEGEVALVYRLGPSGSYVAATNKNGAIYLSSRPNIALLEAAGTYKITKEATANEVYIGYGY